MRIVEEEEELQRYRQHLLRLSGATLIALQQTEHVIDICCQLLKPPQETITVEDVLSSDRPKRQRTLGQLSGLLKDRELFVEDFEKRMDDFVRNRNRFVHQLWVEGIHCEASDYTQQLELLKGMESLILGLLREAHDIFGIFRGLYGAIGLAIVERDRMEHLHFRLLSEWGDDIHKFVEVRREGHQIAE